MLGIPSELLEAVAAQLREAGEARAVQRVETVRGGYSAASKARLITRRGSYLLKWLGPHRPRLFTGEAYSIARLREADVIRVPLVLASADAAGSLPGYILEEWIGHTSTDAHLRRVGSRLGARIAELHRCDRAEGVAVRGYGFGYHAHDWGEAGASTWEEGWTDFFRDRLLAPVVERAIRRELVSTAMAARLERLASLLGRLIGGEERHPSLLHGDLWRGNVVSDSRGEPALVDPVSLFGDRELELTYCEVFGRLPPAFFAAYREVWPIDPGYAERRELYSLYYYLRLLGSPAFPDPTSRIEAILRWYLGPNSTSTGRSLG